MQIVMIMVKVYGRTFLRNCAESKVMFIILCYLQQIYLMCIFRICNQFMLFVINLH